MRGWIALLLLAGSALGQTGVPRFTAAGLPHRPDGQAIILSPGMVIEMYGENFGPQPWCNEQIPQADPRPREACGVRVLVNGRASELWYVGAKQINFKIPEDAPEDGSAPIQVCVRDQCSDPLVARFSLRKAYIRLQGHAYVHGPVWIEVDEPWGDIRYPYSIFPLNFGGNQIEVFFKGEPLAPARKAISMGAGTAAPQDSPWGRLPLHLLYRFDQPGVYSIRFTGRGYRYPGAVEVTTQSDWTEIIVEPYSQPQRDAWLASEAAKARTATPGELAGDIIPSLLAWPDEKALSILLNLMDHPDGLVQQYARMSLNFFDEAVQRRVIPPNRWDDLHRVVISILG